MFFYFRHTSLFVLLSVISSSVIAQESVMLRNRFQVGNEVFLDVTLGQEGVSRSEGSERESKNSTHVLFGFETETVTDSGKANLAMKIHEMEMENPLTPSGTKPDLKKILGLNDAVMRLTLDGRGQVIHAPTLGKTQTAGGQNQLTEQTPYLFCPEEAVEVGSSWIYERQVPLTGASKAVIAYTTYTLNAIQEENGERIADIETVTRIDESDVVVDPFQNQSPGANLVFRFTFKKYYLHTTGNIRFNLTQGHIVSKEESGTLVQEIEHDLSMDDASFPANIVNAFTVTTRAVYFESKP